MSERNAQLKATLAALSFEDREDLLAYLEELQEREEPPLTQEEWEDAWVKEINRRVADVEAGRTKLIPAEEVMQRLKEKFG